MNHRRTAGFVVAAGAVAVLLAGAATLPSRRGESRTAPPQIAPVDLQGEALNAEIARLRERLRPVAEPRQPARNLFSFAAARRTAPAPEPPVAATSGPLQADVPVAPRANVSLVGIAEDAGADGPIRTAILTVDGQLMLTRVGEQASARFTILSITPEGVDVADLVAGTTIRLSLD